MAHIRCSYIVGIYSILLYIHSHVVLVPTKCLIGLGMVCILKILIMLIRVLVHQAANILRKLC